MERRCQPRVSREGESIISGNIMSNASDYFWFCTVFLLPDRTAALHVYVINSSLVMISFENSRQVHVNHISFVLRRVDVLAGILIKKKKKNNFCSM